MAYSVGTRKPLPMEGNRLKRYLATVFDKQAYEAWARRTALDEEAGYGQYREQIIANGDPECERVIAALEAKWSQDR